MAKMDKESTEIAKLVFRDVPKIYFNAFTAGFSPTDALLRLSQNGTPIVEVNMSFGTLKILATTLNTIVGEVEGKLGTIELVRDDEK
ncbi:MAG: hypothetical protein ABI444_04780 [Candidatus Kapaibacterium sp.]|jgi:hypothetical protein